MLKQARSVLRIALGVIAVLLLVACAGRGESTGVDVQVDLMVEPDPPLVGMATLNLTLRDADGNPLTDAKVKVEGTMSHAGMTSVFGDGIEVAPGQYQVADFVFSMGGDWIMLVTGETSSGDTFSERVDVPNVRERAGS